MKKREIWKMFLWNFAGSCHAVWLVGFWVEFWTFLGICIEEFLYKMAREISRWQTACVALGSFYPNFEEFFDKSNRLHQALKIQIFSSGAVSLLILSMSQYRVISYSTNLIFDKNSKAHSWVTPLIRQT